MGEWIVELEGGRKALVHGADMQVVQGHLYCMKYGGGWRPEGANHYDFAFAPGEWRRFWPRPHQDQIDRLKNSLDVAKMLMERAETDEERERLAVFHNETVFDLEQAQARREAVG